MTQNVRKYKYEDDLIKVFDEDLGVHSLTAKNRHLFRDGKGCPIEYNTSTGKCYIHSDKEIVGLELVGTNEVKQKNKIDLAEFNAMSVTIQGV